MGNSTSQLPVPSRGATEGVYNSRGELIAGPVDTNALEFRADVVDRVGIDPRREAKHAAAQLDAFIERKAYSRGYSAGVKIGRQGAGVAVGLALLGGSILGSLITLGLSVYHHIAF